MSEIELLTPEQVAQRLQVKTRTVQEWLRTGRLPGLKLGKLWRVRTSDLAAFMGSRQAAPPLSTPPPVDRAVLQAERAARVDALLGKYPSHTPVDEFLRRKHEETERENRRRENRGR